MDGLEESTGNGKRASVLSGRVKDIIQTCSKSLALSTPLRLHPEFGGPTGGSMIQAESPPVEDYPPSSPVEPEAGGGT